MLQRTHGGFKVRTVKDRRLEGYEGMNHYAAVEMRFSPVPAPDVVEVSNRYHGVQRERIIKHEVKEAELMRRGEGYGTAHKRATRAERKRWWER